MPRYITLLWKDTANDLPLKRVTKYTLPLSMHALAFSASCFSKDSYRGSFASTSMTCAVSCVYCVTVVLQASNLQIIRANHSLNTLLSKSSLSIIFFLPQLCYIVKFLLPFEDIYKKILANNIISLINIIVKI